MYLIEDKYNYFEGTVGENKNPVSGDSINFAVVISVLILAGAAVVLFALLRVKRRKG